MKFIEFNFNIYKDRVKKLRKEKRELFIKTFFSSLNQYNHTIGWMFFTALIGFITVVASAFTSPKEPLTIFPILAYYGVLEIIVFIIIALILTKGFQKDLEQLLDFLEEK